MSILDATQQLDDLMISLGDIDEQKVCFLYFPGIHAFYILGY